LAQVHFRIYTFPTPMMKVSLSVATLALCVFEATAHSWVRELNGGVQRGGVTADDDTDTHYYCPTPDLKDCQPNANTKIVLSAVNQKPCGGITTPSNPMGVATVGGILDIKWPSNGHKDVTGTCVDVYMTPFKADPTMADFAANQIGTCLPYSELEAKIKLASDMAAGQYTVFWKWNFASFFFTSCVDIEVTGGSQPSTATTSAPAEPTKPVATTTTRSPKSLRTTVKPTATTASPKVPTDAGAAYDRHGCNSDKVPSNFCQEAFGQGSFCKDNQDPCGRQQCDGDTKAMLGACFGSRLLL